MMKTLLLIVGFALMIPLVASADTIGVFTDASGSSCDFAPGFNPNITIIHKYSVGATAVQFKVVAAGSSIFGFDTTYPYVPTGIVQTGITVVYAAASWSERLSRS